MSRFFVVTGESSGDKLAALFSSELISEGHEITGWGSTSMRESGVKIVQDISALKIMGWTDVIKSLPKVISLLSQCKKDIRQCKPDAILLVDFGSFNLRIAKWAKSEGFHVIYYCPPKVWASRSNRIHKLQKFTDQIIVLFPFEKEYYEARGVTVHYYGNPIANEIRDHQKDPNFKTKHNLDSRPILSILPGSRRSEIKKTLPIYLKALEKQLSHQVCISCSPGMSNVIGLVLEQNNSELKVIEEGYFDLLANSDMAIVTSGTANLEAGLFAVPQIVGYKTSWLNYAIAKRIIQSRFISLVNLNLDKEVVKELIQKDLTAASLQKHLICLQSDNAKSILAKEYQHLSYILTKEECVKNTVMAISASLHKL